MPYILFDKTRDKYCYGSDPLDGDVTQISYQVPLPVGIYGKPTSKEGGGSPVRDENIPTRIRWNGPRRKLPDVDISHGMFCVSEKFKLIVERFEADMHQFFPVELVWKNGDLAGNYYLFFVNVSLDGMHRELTKASFNIIWELLGHPYHDWMFDKAKINGRHIWMDRYITSGVFISDELAKTLQDENVSGIGLQHIEAG